jgi:hypothetical protein
MKIRLFSNLPDLYYCTDEKTFFDRTWGRSRNEITMDQMIRYLRTRYTNKERFHSNFIKPITQLVGQTHSELLAAYDEMANGVFEMTKTLSNLYVDAMPYSYVEAFRLQNEGFRSLVFGSIRVPEMIKEMGHKRLAVAGQPVRHKQFSKSGEFLGYKEYDVIFETHEVSGDKLGLSQPIYAVRCWCTTTENEHWLWIDSKYKDDPLEAIARTFFIHENLIPFIKELKRQGDVLLVELTDDVEPRGQLVSLSKEMYFGLLTAQS